MTGGWSSFDCYGKKTCFSLSKVTIRRSVGNTSANRIDCRQCIWSAVVTGSNQNISYKRYFLFSTTDLHAVRSTPFCYACLTHTHTLNSDQLVKSQMSVRIIEE